MYTVFTTDPSSYVVLLLKYRRTRSPPIYVKCPQVKSVAVLIKYQDLIYLESTAEQQTHQNLSNNDLRAMYIYHVLDFLAQ